MEPLVTHLLCVKHLAEVQKDLAPERFYCCRCREWLRERPELTDDLVGEAVSINITPTKVVSIIGRGALRVGVLTITVNEKYGDEKHPPHQDDSETQRYCPKCAPIAKDALLQLGFNLGIT